MKRCPTCQRTYTDQNLSYCIDDGTPLVSVSVDDDPTVVSPGRSTTPEGEDWNAVAYRPPGAYVPPEVRKRRVWPWVLGLVGLLALVIAGLAIAAAFVLPGMMRRSNSNETAIERSNRNSNVPTPTPRNSPSINSNSQIPANGNANTNTNTNTSTDAPTDKELVLAQLRDIEHEWTVANLNADKKKLERILADDYVGPSNNGGMEGRVVAGAEFGPRVEPKLDSEFGPQAESTPEATRSREFLYRVWPNSLVRQADDKRVSDLLNLSPTTDRQKS